VSYYEILVEITEFMCNPVKAILRMRALANPHETPDKQPNQPPQPFQTNHPNPLNHPQSQGMKLPNNIEPLHQPNSKYRLDKLNHNNPNNFNNNFNNGINPTITQVQPLPSIKLEKEYFQFLNSHNPKSQGKKQSNNLNFLVA